MIIGTKVSISNNLLFLLTQYTLSTKKRDGAHWVPGDSVYWVMRGEITMKFLAQPVRPFIITQKFGENRACVSLDGMKKVISCDGMNPPVGYRSLYGVNGHGGIDIKTTHGQEVYCACDGVVASIDTNPKSGLDVRIDSVVEGVTYRHIYEHLLGYQVKVGDVVQQGQLIGWADNTGYSSGDHLHFELRRLSGTKWIPIDPIPHMEEVFALVKLLQVSLIGYLKELVAILLDRSADKLR